MTFALPVALAAVLAAEPSPPARHDLDALLSRPVSPGVLVLLTPYLGTDPRAVAKIVEGLGHADVSQWRYTPTLVDGDPVSVFMTVTVNYRLQ